MILILLLVLKVNTSVWLNNFCSFSVQSGIYVGLEPVTSGQLWLMRDCLNTEHSFSEKVHTPSAHSVSWKNNDYLILCGSLEQIFSFFLRSVIR